MFQLLKHGWRTTVTMNIGLETIIFVLFLGCVLPRKRHFGPCIYVTEPDTCPDDEYVQVYIFTQKNKNTGQKVVFQEASDTLSSTNFDPKRENKIVIHGFNTDMYLDVLQNIKNEYLASTDLNVFMVNYPKLVSSAWCYLAAQHNIVHVGKCLALLINAIRRHGSNRIHLIGFSLGAHVTNHVALNIKGGKVDRITGLDPAGPGFTLRGKDHRLDSSDAHFVDVVHTNGGLQGDIEERGDVDFYMNGGISQPGCFNNKKRKVQKKVCLGDDFIDQSCTVDYPGAHLDGSFSWDSRISFLPSCPATIMFWGLSNYLNCNHRRAPMYFAESINSKVPFLGWKCEGYLSFTMGNCKPGKDLIPMGEHVPKGSSGFRIVYTASSPPFALGDKLQVRSRALDDEYGPLHFANGTLYGNPDEVKFVEELEKSTLVGRSSGLPFAEDSDV